MALLSHSLPIASRWIAMAPMLGGMMLDNSEKTRELIAALKAALPFEVALTPELVAQLAKQQKPVRVKPVETVLQISYLGDEGGIACHIRQDGSDAMIVVSLTNVRVARTLPFAAAVVDYQKHRVKKIRKQQRRR